MTRQFLFSVTGSGIFALNQFDSVGTSVGDLTFNQSSDVLFSGRIGAVQAGVPEPGTWAMMLLGFGVVGGAMRYRRRKTTISYA